MTVLLPPIRAHLPTERRESPPPRGPGIEVSSTKPRRESSTSRSPRVAATLARVVSERDGCDALARAFEQRGYAIVRDVPLDLEGLRFDADGWDAAARVGFEYLTHEAGDHLDLSPAEIARLGELMARGELSLLLVDEHEVDTLEDLTWAAHRFLDEVQRRKSSRSPDA